VQLELATGDRSPHLRRHARPASQECFSLALEREPAAARRLRLVHRRVRVAQQRLGVGRVIRIQADADAGAGPHLGTGDCERLAEGDVELRTDGLGDVLGSVVQVGEQHQELVAAVTGEHIGIAQHGAQASCHRRQELVADRVAEASLTALKSSRSTNSTATDRFIRRARATARSSCSSTRKRFGSPVRRSW
jgi:hypothetical protein